MASQTPPPPRSSSLSQQPPVTPCRPREAPYQPVTLLGPQVVKPAQLTMVLFSVRTHRKSTTMPPIYGLSNATPSEIVITFSTTTCHALSAPRSPISASHSARPTSCQASSANYGAILSSYPSKIYDNASNLWPLKRHPLRDRHHFLNNHLSRPVGPAKPHISQSLC